MTIHEQAPLWEEIELLSGGLYGRPADKLSSGQLHDVLGRAITARLSEDWARSKEAHCQKRRAYYFSAEFLMGRMVFHNLYNLGILEQTRDLFAQKGIDLISSMEEIDDAALGNGGLGRLAACFLDSAATHGVPLDGYGIRYKDGLFAQSIKNGFQAETADDWQRLGDPWSIRREEDAVTVSFAGQTVRAVPYDMAVVGYGTHNCNTLRLWQSEPLTEFDFTLFNEQCYGEAVREKNEAENISRVLYPNDDTDEGRRLRLKQQYFFCSASLQDIMKRYRLHHPGGYEGFAAHCAIQLNDTHPTVAIPELIRLLEADGLSFEEAFSIAQRTFHYTNHTIMAEALEKWDQKLFSGVLPEVFAIIGRINDRLIAEFRPQFPLPEPVEPKQTPPQKTAPSMEEDATLSPALSAEATPTTNLDASGQEKAPAASERAPSGEAEEKTEEPARAKEETAAPPPVEDPMEGLKILSGNVIHMARLAVYGSSHVNGVARLHTQILKDSTLKEWYALYPQRFQNKTNGITQRRWLGLCNPEFSTMITGLIGDGWLKDLTQLKKLEPLLTPAVIAQFNKIKQEKKRQLCEAVYRQEGVTIDPSFVFDIQAKRLHEYKRQLLNAFSILDLYFQLKDGTLTDFTPTLFLFGAKAAPGYFRAKGIIKYINEIARLVDGDPDVKDKLQVLFVSNYNVSYAEKLMPAADISEQISTAGTEASGTGNMKFMLNGAVTLGTYDGANVEIVEQAGEENNYIFGAKVEEIARMQDSYDPKKLYKTDPRIRRVVDTLIDGTLDDGGTGMFRELYTSLLEGASWHRADNYFLLYDLPSYVDAKLRAVRDYRDREAFGRKCLLNAANAGMFSSDRTILQYAEELWEL